MAFRPRLRFRPGFGLRCTGTMGEMARYDRATALGDDGRRRAQRAGQRCPRAGAPNERQAKDVYFVRPALSQPPDWNSTGVGRQATTTDQEQTNEAAEDRHCHEQHKTELGRACRLLRNEREGNEGRAVRRNGCVHEDAVKVLRARRCCGPRCGGRLAGKEQRNQLIG